MGTLARIASTLLLATVAVVSGPGRGRAEPYIPADDGAVLERLPVSPLDPTARRLQGLRAALAARPDDLALATRAAGLYIEEGRTLSDPRYYGYAQGALAPWWQQDDAPALVIVLRATIRQHDHDFTGALRDLSLALRADPTNAQAWLTQAVVQQVRGEYAAARRSCLEVLQLASPLVAVTCVSGVDSLTGSAGQSYGALLRAFERATNADRAARLWALTTLAEMAARSGWPERAEAHFQQALGLGRPDDYLLGVYADFLLDQERPADVCTLLRDTTRSDALLLRLALAEARLAAPERLQHVQMLHDRLAAARLRGDTVHRREEARFALHLLADPATALTLARDNWTVQREPADARILLEAALAAGDRAAAGPVLAFLADTRIEDVTLARAAAPLQGAPR